MTEEAMEDQSVQSAELSAGATLSRARKAQGLTLEDVSRALKLAPKQVEALENDQYDQLPGITFVRGFARNYARLLQLDPEVVLGRLPGARPDEKLQAISSPNARIDISNRRGRTWLWIFLILIILLVGGTMALYEFLRQPMPARAPATPPAPQSAPAALAPPAQGTTAVPATDNAARPDGALQGSPISIPEAPAPEAQPTAVTGENANPSENEEGAVLTFSGDSWVEARDKTGKIVYSRLHKSGETAQISGQPPLALVIGRAAAVELKYHGKPVNLEPHIRGSVARLTLE